jgi:PAS domain S-box-containing protein
MSGSEDSERTRDDGRHPLEPVARAGVGIVDDEGRWLQVDHVLAAIVGRAPEQLRGRPIDDLIPPSTRAAFVRVWRELAKRGGIHSFWRWLRGDGTLVLVEMEISRERPGRHRVVLSELGMDEPASPGRRTGPLTARERDVLRFVSLGLPNRDIAGRLHVAPGTVKNHLSAIYRKLGVRDRAGAVAEALRQDLVR